MLRRIFGLTLVIGVLGTVLIAPASAAPQAVGRVVRDGVQYTVYEETRPGDPNLYRYFVEDGALPGASGPRLQMTMTPRGSGMETAGFIAATLLFAASVFAVYRRLTLLRLLETGTA
jgi:hypothetical protein